MSLEGLLKDPAVSHPLKAVLLAWWRRDPLDAAHDASALAAVMGNRATPVLDAAQVLGTGPDRLLNWADVGRRTGLGRTTVWRMRKAGHFPEPASISPGRVAWTERDIAAWIRSRSPSALRPPGQAAHDPNPGEAQGCRR